MSKILAMAFKDLTLLWRDKGGMFWVLVFPLIMGVFFGTVFSSGMSKPQGSMKISVVDEDQSADSAKFIERLKSSSALVIDLQQLDAARDLVRRGRRVAFVHLQKGFGAAEDSLFGDSQAMQIGIDPSRSAEAGILQGLLIESRFKLLVDRFMDPRSLQKPVQKGLAEIEAATEIPAVEKVVLLTFMRALNVFLATADKKLLEEGGGPQFESFGKVGMSEVKPSGGPSINAYSVSFPQSSIWAVIGCAAAFAISFVQERQRGTLLRMRVAPLSRAELLAGKACACFFACAGSITLLLLIASMPPFRVPLSHVPQLILAVLCSSICFVGLMMFASVLGRTEQAVAGSAWGILLISSMLGGGMIPLVAMPAWMQKVSHVSPVKWSILSLEGAIWRGFSMGEMLLPCAILVSVGAATFFIGTLLLRRAEG